MSLGPARFTRALVRTFAVQGSWNYRTLIGGGLAYALAPLLEGVYSEDSRGLRRSLEAHAAEFNAHPYLTPIAVGALARIEADGVDPETRARFRTALQAPLGALGDQAIWAGWRPFCILVAGTLFLSGVPVVAATLVFLIGYNVGHIGLRCWGLRLGWREGLRVGATLKSLPVNRVARTLVVINQALMGIVGALLVARLPGAQDAVRIGLAAALVGLGGYLVPKRVGGLAIAALIGAMLL
ncbi:MAG: PTS system mannose/fructose/sorbose family transporter subunit IID [Gemmatimonadetes bacterium]|nr:PTS system mannose/fructose/sorbose family transporter subunit IID [Gemmatimonadota bacterium]